jgi:hypothetical protein
MTILIGAFALALLATLALAAFLTPARWWRRPNVKALAVLLIGTWGIGSALLALAPDRAEARVADVVPLMRTPDTADTADTTDYLVFEDLNLRAAAGVHARRLALVPAGSTVTTTGVREGDWWQVRAKVNQLPVDGWVSSLWLRRAEEAQGRRAHTMH